MKRLFFSPTTGCALVVAVAACFAACSSSSSESADDAKARLERETGVSWAVDHPSPFVTHLHPLGGAPPALVNGKSADVAAREFFKNYSALFGFQNVDGELALDAVTPPDGIGVTHAQFHQQAGNAEVEGARLGVHFDAQGRISWIGTLYVPNLGALNTTPALDAAAALGRAQADTLARFPPGALGAPEATPPPTLTVVPSPSPVLSYRVKVSFIYREAFADPVPSGLDVPPLREVMNYHVDANSGAILDARSGLIPEDTAKGRGVLYYQKMDLTDTKQFPVLADGMGKWRMFRSGTDAATGLYARAAGAPIIASASLDPFDSIMPNQGSHVDAYSNFVKIDGYWRALGRKSWDDAGATIRLIVNDPNPALPNNAWWDGSDAFHFSANNPGGQILAQPLDVCGHEFQHAINQQLLALPHQDQTGALDESLADSFGEFIEHVYRPNAADNVVLGESQPPILRNLADPKATMQPDHMDDLRTGAFDSGYVHDNAGIPNKAWWLITIGGTHHGVTTTGIGWAAAEALYYSTLKARPPVSRFVDFATAMTEQATNLPGNVLDTVVCAWYAVGVLTQDGLQRGFPGVNCNTATDGGVDASRDMAGDAMDGSHDGAMDASRDGAMDAAPDGAGDGGMDAAVPDMGVCTPTAADFEGMQVKVNGIMGEFADATMTITKVVRIGSPMMYLGSFGGQEAGNPKPLSMDLPATATVFSFGDGNQPAGVVGFPAVFEGKNGANRNGRSNLIAVWQDGMKQWQWAWNVSGGSWMSNGSFPQWHEYQFVYDSRKPSMGRTRFDVFLGGGAMPSGWTFIRSAPTVASVTFAGNPACALPGQ